jgi:hypothetical protein
MRVTGSFLGIAIPLDGTIHIEMVKIQSGREKYGTNI